MRYPRPKEKLGPAARRERMARDIARLAAVAGHMGRPRGAVLLFAGCTAAVTIGNVLAALLFRLV